MKKVKKNLFGFVLLGLVIIFFYIYLRDINLEELRAVRVSWAYVVIATVLATIFRYFGALIWIHLLRRLGANQLKTQLFQLFYVYAKSWMGRYIPGSVTWILGKIYYASKLGVSKRRLAIVSVLEGGLQVAVLFCASLLLLTLDSRLEEIGDNYRLLLIPMLLLCVIVFIPRIFNKIMALSYKIYRRETLDKKFYVNGRMVVDGILLYGIAAILSGFSLFLIVKSVDPSLGFGDAIFIMGVGNLATAIGMMAIFAPSGLGIREGVQIILFSLIMPKELALAAILLTRVWATVCDLIFLLLARASRNFKISP